MQAQLTAELQRKECLPQFGEAVAKVSLDLRNILTTAQLFTECLEFSQGSIDKRMAPKLVNLIARAV